MSEPQTRKVRPRDLEPGMKVMHWTGAKLVAVEVLSVKKKGPRAGTGTGTVYLARTAALLGSVPEFTRKYTPGAWVEVEA